MSSRYRPSSSPLIPPHPPDRASPGSSPLLPPSFSAQMSTRFEYTHTARERMGERMAGHIPIYSSNGNWTGIQKINVHMLPPQANKAKTWFCSLHRGGNYRSCARHWRLYFISINHTYIDIAYIGSIY